MLGAIDQEFHATVIWRGVDPNPDSPHDVDHVFALPARVFLYEHDARHYLDEEVGRLWTDATMCHATLLKSTVSIEAAPDDGKKRRASDPEPEQVRRPLGPAVVLDVIHWDATPHVARDGVTP